MIRRIFLNFSRKILWTLCRLVLFVLMIGCFFASMLMDGLTKQVNTQLVSDADLFLSVYTQFDMDLAAAQDGEAAKQVINDYGNMIRTLDVGGNAIYADVPIRGRTIPRMREFSWLIPENEEIKIPLTNKGRLIDVKTAQSLVNRLESYLKRPYCDIDRFTRDLHDAAERTVQEYQLVTVERPDFLKQHLGVVSLVSGRLMTQEEVDSGAAVCLVPSDRCILLADGYKVVKPGDMIQMSFYRYTDKKEILDDGGFGYRLLGYDSIEIEVIGTYESSALDEQDNTLIYIPRTFFVQILEAQDGFFQKAYPENYTSGSAYQNLTSHPLIFQFDSLEHINAFIEDLKTLPEYQANEFQYYANIDQTLHMLAGFYGMAGGVRSMLSIFGVIAVAFSILLAMLDVFYRRREIAILQSMGESPGKIITQFTLESLLMLVVSAALAAPVALRLMKGAVPALFAEEGADSVLSASSTFSSISTEIAEKTIDQTALISGLNYVSSDYIRIALLLLLMAACCTAAVWVCTKKFNARNLLND